MDTEAIGPLEDPRSEMVDFHIGFLDSHQEPWVHQTRMQEVRTKLGEIFEFILLDDTTVSVYHHQDCTVDLFMEERGIRRFGILRVTGHESNIDKIWDKLHEHIPSIFE